MIVKLIPLLLIITLKNSRCSLVIDEASQKGLYLSDYCPNMKYCREGSHVVCMYYDPNNVKGPRCHNAVNVSITADIAIQLLEITNAIRSKSANGKETGKGGELLPRGYGIMRLKWDNELATFAQLLADQCHMTNDVCRSTKKFPDPGQSIGLVRFLYPDWKKGDSGPGLTNDKIIYALTQIVKSWYMQKQTITGSVIKFSPDWDTIPNHGGQLYLRLVYGAATHMGCGLSGYPEYAYFDNMRASAYNALQLVCNYSARPRKGLQTYETKPPIPGQGYSPKCGCPPGYEEDADCLCNELPSPPNAQTESPCPFEDSSGNCDPALVLLPIFTIEDAPPEKLIKIPEQTQEDPLKNFVLQRIDNSSVANKRQGMAEAEETTASMEIFDFLHEKDAKNKQAPRPSSFRTPIQSVPSYDEEQLQSPIYLEKSEPRLPPPKQSPVPWRLPPSGPYQPSQSSPSPPPRPPTPPVAPPPLKINMDLETGAFHGKRSRPLPRPPPKYQPVTKKSSIFTKVAQFKLPAKTNKPLPFGVIKKDVAPRKDFSNLNKVVNDYLNRRPGYKRNNDKEVENKPKKLSKSHTEEKPQTVITETRSKSAKETVIDFNQYVKEQNISNNNDKDVGIDNKVMSLLDTLEREVKHIALDGNEKELFDAKIRKIYGTIVGKTADLKFPKPMPLRTTDLEASEIGNRETKMSDQLEPYHEEEPGKIRRTKNYIDLVHKQFDQKKHNDNNMDVFGDTDRKHNEDYDNDYNDNVDHTYGNKEHNHTNDLDRNINQKYSEKNLDHKYIKRNLKDNFNHKHNYNFDRGDDVPVFRNTIKINANKDVFRELKHNSLNSQEHTNFRYKDVKTNDGSPDRYSFITKDTEKRKGNEIKYRNRVKNLHLRNIRNDPLSHERRKYYQEKLANVRRKIRGSQKIRQNNDPRNEQPLRRMRKTQEVISRKRSKSQANNFYAPERAKFLHGF